MINWFFQGLVNIISDLMQKLKAEKSSKLQLELQIREDVCNEMKKQFVAIEKQCRYTYIRLRFEL